MEAKSTDTNQQNTTAAKEAIKSKIKTENVSVCSKQENDGTPDFLNPSVLDEVLAEKKMALMRSPDVVKFLQMHQSRLAQSKQSSKEDDD